MVFKKFNFKYLWYELLTIVFMTAVLLQLEYVGLLEGVRAFGERAVRPFVMVINQNIFGFAQPFSQRSNVRSQESIQDLENKYVQVLSELGELEQLREENELLRSMLEDVGNLSGPRILTVPIASYISPMVAAGREEGVTTGSMVIIRGTLIGLIREVSTHQSRVELLHQKLDRPILAQTESGAQGLVTGDGRRVLFTEVPHHITLQPGERVLTVGQEGIGPNILIGTLSTFEERLSAPTQTVVLEQYVSYYRASIIEIW